MLNFFTTGCIFYVTTVDSSRINDFIDGIVIIVCGNYYYSSAWDRT